MEKLVQLLRAEQSDYLHEALAGLLLETAAFESSDPRERISATIGCLKEHSPEYIVDYNTSLPQVLLDVATCEGDSEEARFALLRGMCHVEESSDDPSIPSWLPTWQFKDLRWRPLCDFHEADGTDLSQADLAIEEDRRTLTTGVVLIDRVASVMWKHEAKDALPSGWTDNPEQKENLVSVLSAKCAWLLACYDMMFASLQFTNDGITRNKSELAEQFMHYYCFGYEEEDIDKAQAYTGFLCHSAMAQAISQSSKLGEDIEKLVNRYRAICKQYAVDNDGDDDPSQRLKTMEDVLEYKSQLSELGIQFALLEAEERHGRAMVVSEAGRIGWASKDTKEGDVLCIFFGYVTPFVVRKVIAEYGSVGESDQYRLVGACFVADNMDGEPCLDDTLPRIAMSLV